MHLCTHTYKCIFSVKHSCASSCALLWRLRGPHASERSGNCWNANTRLKPFEKERIHQEWVEKQWTEKWKRRWRNFGHFYGRVSTLQLRYLNDSFVVCRNVVLFSYVNPKVMLIFNKWICSGAIVTLRFPIYLYSRITYLGDHEFVSKMNFVKKSKFNICQHNNFGPIVKIVGDGKTRSIELQNFQNGSHHNFRKYFYNRIFRRNFQYGACGVFSLWNLFRRFLSFSYVISGFAVDFPLLFRSPFVFLCLRIRLLCFAICVSQNFLFFLDSLLLVHVVYVSLRRFLHVGRRGNVGGGGIRRRSKEELT